MRRSLIYNGLKRFAPDLLQLFLWSYGSSSNMFLQNGEYVGECQTGVRQGDPLGPLYFAVGLQFLLARLSHDQLQVTVGAFFDDITICGPVGVMNAVLNFFDSPIRRAQGINLNRAKSSCWVCGDEVPLDEHRGVKVLGVPIGSDAFMSVSTEDLVRGQAAVVTWIKRLPASTAFILLRRCINARPGYISRCQLPCFTSQPLEGFDRCIDQALISIAGALRRELPSFAGLLRCLPFDLGGISLRRLSVYAGAAWSASFLAAASRDLGYRGLNSISSIVSFAPSVQRILHLVRQCCSQPCLMTDDQDVLHFSLAAPMEGSPPQLEFIPLQKDLSEIITSNLHAHLSNRLDQEGDRFAKAWLVSASFKSSGSFLLCGGTANKYFKVTEDAFKLNLCARLMIPVVQHNIAVAPMAQRFRCNCFENNRLHLNAEHDVRFHAMDCNQGRHRLKRHDWIRNTLLDTLERMFGKGCARKEVELVGTQHRVVADLEFKHQGAVYYLDISVTNPCTASGLANNSDVRTGAALQVREEEKVRHYEEVLRDLDFPRDHFFPFVLESSGRIGKYAFDFLGVVAELALPPEKAHINKAKKLKTFRDRVQVIMAAKNGDAFALFAKTVTLLA